MTEIELTDVQRKAIQAEGGKPVAVVDPATQQHYILLSSEQYERVRPLLEEDGRPAPAAAATPPGTPPAKDQPPRIRLCDLPTPPAVVETAKWWCRNHPARERRDVEEHLKLGYYWGGQSVYVLRSPEGTVVIPIPERYKDTPGLRYVLLTPDERSRACLTVPEPLDDDVARI